MCQYRQINIGPTSSPILGQYCSQYCPNIRMDDGFPILCQYWLPILRQYWLAIIVWLYWHNIGLPILAQYRKTVVHAYIGSILVTILSQYCFQCWTNIAPMLLATWVAIHYAASEYMRTAQPVLQLQNFRFRFPHFHCAMQFFMHYTVCDCETVTLVDKDHVGWKISPTTSLFVIVAQRPSVHLFPGQNGEIYFGESGRLKVGIEGKSGVLALLEPKSGNIFETRKDRGNVTKGRPHRNSPTLFRTVLSLTP